MLLSNQICGPNSVDMGLANGTVGRAVGLMLDPLEPPAPEGQRHMLQLMPKGVLVHVPGLRVQPLPDLPQSAIDMANGAPESIIFVKPMSTSLEKAGRTCSRYQVPLMPAYALTMHKAQGLDLDRAIIDCQSDLPTANYEAHNMAYVTLSRVKKSDGVAFLGDLPDNWIHHQAHPDILAEEARLRQFLIL